MTTAVFSVLLHFKMADRNDLQQRLVALIDVGYSASAAGRRLNIPNATAKRWARRYLDEGRVGRRHGSGRPRISTREQDAAVVEACRENPFHSANQITTVSNFPGSSRTVINRLREAGLRNFRAPRKEDITPEQAMDRYTFASGFENGNFDWGRVIFSDETTISTEYNGPATVYRERGRRFDPRYVVRTHKSGRISVSIWGWISRDGAGMLERIYGRLTGRQYRSILSRVLLPSARERFPVGNVVFLQDNSPVHHAGPVQRWFRRRPEIEVMDLPLKSPDLNVIENVWAELKKRRRDKFRDVRPRNQDELWNQVLDAWEDLAEDQDYFHRLVDSMPSRIEGVIENEGMWSGY